MAAYISEVHLFTFNGFPVSNQYIELRGEPNEKLAAGTYFVAVESTSADSGPGPVLGQVLAVFDLSGQLMGDNGYLALLPGGHQYEVDPAARVLEGTDSFNGMPGNIYSSSYSRLVESSNSYLLIQSTTPPTLDSDIDQDNDGVPDGEYLNWTILDGFTHFRASSEFYGPYGNFAPIAFWEHSAVSAMPNSVAVSTEGRSVSYIARLNNSTGYSPEDWLVGGTWEQPTDGRSDHWNLRLWFMELGPNHPWYAFRKLDHVGAANWHVPTVVHVFRDDNSNGIQDSGEQPITDATVTATPLANSQGDFYVETISPSPLDRDVPLTTYSDKLTLTTELALETGGYRLSWDPIIGHEGAITNGMHGRQFFSEQRLRMDFFQPAHSVSINVRNTWGPELVSGRLEIFDTNNQSLGSMESSALEFGQQETLSLFSADNKIAYAVAYEPQKVLGGLAWFSDLTVTWPVKTTSNRSDGRATFYDLPRNAYRFSVTVPAEYDVVHPTTGSYDVQFTPLGGPTTLNFGVRGNRPPQLDDSFGSVRESAAAGTVIAMLPLELGYSTQETRTTLTGEAQDLFAIDPVTREIKLLRPALDFETKSRYTLNLLVQDIHNAALKDTAVFELMIEDVNEAPTIETSGLSMAENSTAGTLAGTIVVRDQDQGDQWNLELVSQSVPWFNLDLVTGEVKVAGNASINYEQHQQVTIVVQATDRGGLKRTSTIPIAIVDQNDPPALTTAIDDLRIVDGKHVALTIAAGTFADEDTSDTLTLRASQAGGVPLPSWLTFNQQTSTLSGTPSHADVGTWNLVIEASDKGGLTAVASFVILVEPNPWRLHNPNQAVDVSGDNQVTPIDALLVINFLNTQGSRAVGSQDSPVDGWLDTSADNSISPIDALLVINELNRGPGGAEGEPSAVSESGSTTVIASPSFDILWPLDGEQSADTKRLRSWSRTRLTASL